MRMRRAGRGWWNGVVLGAMVLPAVLAAQAPIAPPGVHRLTVRPAGAVTSGAELVGLRRVAPSRVGLVVGGIAGAALGTYVGMAACSFNDDDQRNCTTRMPLHAVTGALIGGGIGWVVGRAFGR